MANHEQIALKTNCCGLATSGNHQKPIVAVKFLPVMPACQHPSGKLYPSTFLHHLISNQRRVLTVEQLRLLGRAHTSQNRIATTVSRDSHTLRGGASPHQPSGL